MKLVIVESPNKCNTIQNYLGKNYLVKASFGQVRDLATSGKDGLGVDINNNFAPIYKIGKGKTAVVEELKKAAKKSEEVILATDADREGEAIAWHLASVLGLDVGKTKRLEFHEITKDAILAANAEPRTIDMNLVSSQETRRILDRIIGFKLSTLLKKKIKSKSAGRVQSAALRLIFDHDKEIQAFKSEEYWVIKAKALYDGVEYELTYKSDINKKKDINNKDEADAILNNIGEEAEVCSVKKTSKITQSKVPFMTSTLQQEAFNKLKFKTSETQRVAQQLFEGGLNINGDQSGLITYIRVDDTFISETFANKALAYIGERFGKEYVGKPKVSAPKKNSQGAHEAIRPTDVRKTPEYVRPYLSSAQYRLYKLIYERTLASLMTAKKEEILTVELKSNNQLFTLSSTRTIFAGYSELTGEKDDSNSLPSLKVGDVFKITHKEGEQKFTQPPAPYNEAKVVKLMEEVGIGRPSTYASTIKILKDRKYVVEKDGVLNITEQGNKTVAVLKKYFPAVVDTSYTAQMEERLDKIVDGETSRDATLHNFYTNFSKDFDHAVEYMYADEYIPTGTMCPKCGSKLVYKNGPSGVFVACSAFPKCDYVEGDNTSPEFVGKKCPNCGSELLYKKSKKGSKFIACSAFPKCRYTENIITESDKNNVKKCPDCGGDLVKRRGPRGYFYGCSNYPRCNHMKPYRKIKSNKTGA